MDRQEHQRKKKVANKVMCYFPLTLRLKRLYSSRHTVKEMRSHDSRRAKEDGLLRHPANEHVWKDFDAKYPNFVEDVRNNAH